MVSYQGYGLVVAGIVLSLIEAGFALRCWKCTTQTDSTCRDYFNTTRILLNQRHMDSSYPYGSVQPVRNEPHLAFCEGMHTSTYGQVKNVCLKRVFKVPDGLDEVHRECRMVHKDLKVGTCPDDIISSRPGNLEFCGTCEYDGCNSANMNSMVFVGLVPTVLLLLGK